MGQYIKLFKDWYKIAKPNKKLWILQFIGAIIPQICVVLEAFYMAKVTTCVSRGAYKLAIANLIIAFAILAIRIFSWDFNYRNTYDLVGHSYVRIQKELYDKIINSSDDDINTTSKEKLIQIMHGDVFDVSYFADVICSKFRYLISSVICIGYVLFASVYIGLIMVAVYIINIFVLNKINDKIASAQEKIKTSTDKEYEVLGEALESKDYVKDLNIKEKVAERTLHSASQYMKDRDGYNVAVSYLDNYFYMFYRFIQFALTIAMIFILKGNVITLTAYFVIISYLGETLSYNKEFCTLFTEVKKVAVATQRVNLILNFNNRSTINIGNENRNELKGEIDFIDVYYTAKNDEFKLQNLYDVSFHIDANQFVIFKGNRGCGKRTIFYLLRRMVEVNSGEIYLDKIALREYNDKAQLENLNYVLTKPYFFNDTILQNLKIVNSDMTEIENACKMVNVYDTIIKLKEGFNSPVSMLSLRDKYLLSVARTLLMNSEIVVFYEFPTYLSKQDEEYIKSIINIIRLNRTIIMFTATNVASELADKVYNVENGKVVLEKDNTKNQVSTLFDALEEFDNKQKLPKKSKKNALNRILKNYAKEVIDK